MIEGKKILAVIPARGGSKGVPRKNIRDLAGKPLLAWTILEARKSAYIDRLIVSTEDPEIMEVARAWDCETPFRRPEELAQDHTPGADPVIHAVTELPGYDYVLLLQPTSPLRLVQDIDGLIEACVRAKAPGCVSIVKVASHPMWMYKTNEQGYIRLFIDQEKEIPRRQDLPPAYEMNGALYMTDVAELLKTGHLYSDRTLGYEMPEERSHDIDTQLDFVICGYLLEQRQRKEEYDG